MMRQSVPTVTTWFDRRKPPESIRSVVTLPDGTKDTYTWYRGDGWAGGGGAGGVQRALANTSKPMLKPPFVVVDEHMGHRVVVDIHEGQYVFAEGAGVRPGEIVVIRW